MQARNGATFGEYAALRAIAALGGSATLEQLSEIRIKGLVRILDGMLPVESRRAVKARTRKSRAGRVRPPLLRLERPRAGRGPVVYRITPEGRTCANHTRPWLSTKETREVSWEVSWTADEVEVRRPDRGMVFGTFSEAGMTIQKSAGPSVQGRPSDADWAVFCKAMKETYGARVVSEAKPDFLRWPEHLLATKKDRAGGAVQAVAKARRGVG